MPLRQTDFTDISTCLWLSYFSRFVVSFFSLSDWGFFLFHINHLYLNCFLFFLVYVID